MAKRTKAEATVVDTGFKSFKGQKSASAAWVSDALDPFEAKTAPIVMEAARATKTSRCQRLKGGGEAKCRVQLVAAPGGKSLALRLCHKTEAAGFLLPVTDPRTAQEKARKFCECKEKSTDAAKCARDLGARAEAESTKVSYADAPEAAGADDDTEDDEG